MEQYENTPRPRRRSAFRRNRRMQGTYLGYLLIGTLVLCLVLGLLIKDRDYSENENRKLAQFPAFSLSALTDGSWFSGLGEYMADQFPGRDGWISLNLSFQKLLGQKESGGVYLCGDDYLMQIPSQPNEEALQRNLKAINAFAARHTDLTMVMTVVPNAVTVLADKLPTNAPVRDQAADLQGIRQSLTGVEFVDVTSALTAHADQQLFYRTDHHWTSLGAFYGFRALAPALSIEAPELDSYTVYPVSTTFEGTLSSKSGSHGVTDQVDIYVPDTDISYYVTYPGESPVCSLYKREALEQKDHYTVFFGGNYSRVDITTTADTGRSLLIFKDSYANCLVQFLYPYFDHITMIDPRYYYDDVETVLNAQAITDVLYLYNADTFLTDTSLGDVLGG